MAQKDLAYTTVDGDTIGIGEDSIIYVQEEGAGSKVTYSLDGAKLKEVSVTDALADSIAGGALPGLGNGKLIQVTVDGKSVGINADRVFATIEAAVGGEVLYSAEGIAPKRLATAETATAVRALINAL